MIKQGIKLKFKIDKDYLLVHLLSAGDYFCSPRYRKDIINLRAFAKKENPKLYGLMSAKLRNIDWVRKGQLTRITKSDPRYLSAIKRNKFFKKIVVQTQQYRAFCQKQWLKNYKIASRFIQYVTGFVLDKKIDVYLTHPGLYNGDFLIKQNIITWGYREEWPNYQSVYLWHEVLHSYLDVDPRYRWLRAVAYHDGESDFEEGVIELVADETLRSLLNHTKYLPFVGRENLIPFKKKLLPIWEKYLKQDQRDFSDFLKQAKQIFLKMKILHV